MYSDKEHGMRLDRGTRETEDTGMSVGNGKAMVGKAQTESGRSEIDIKPRLPFLLSQSARMDFIPLPIRRRF